MIPLFGTASLAVQTAGHQSQVLTAPTAKGFSFGSNAVDPATAMATRPVLTKLGGLLAPVLRAAAACARISGSTSAGHHRALQH
jgi:hypothetical protein